MQRGGRDGAMEEAGTKETAQIRGVSRDEEGKKRVEKVEVVIHKPDTLRYIEKKMHNKGIGRMDRHPADGLGVAHPPPKSGRGGKYTWEGPEDIVESELDPVPPAIDPRDPNYVEEEEAEEAPGGGDDGDERKVAVREAEVAAVAEAKEGGITGRDPASLQAIESPTIFTSCDATEL